VTGRTISIAAAAALALALGAFALDTRSDHDDSFDFATLERYRWAEGTAAVSPVVQEHIEGAVRTQLEAKGLSEDAEAPDVWVVTHAATATRVRFDAAEHGFGLGDDVSHDVAGRDHVVDRADALSRGHARARDVGPLVVVERDQSIG